LIRKGILQLGGGLARISIPMSFFAVLSFRLSLVIVLAFAMKKA
jgi:hypothetical protein